MTHDDDDDDEDEDAFHYDGFRGDPQEPFDSAWRFGFSFGPDGMRIQEPPVFGHVFREMEEIFAQMGHWREQPDSGSFGIKTESFSLCSRFCLFLLLSALVFQSYLVLVNLPYDISIRICVFVCDLFSCLCAAEETYCNVMY